MKNRDKLKFSIYRLTDQNTVIEDLIKKLQSNGYHEKHCKKPNSRIFLNEGESKPPNWRGFLTQLSTDPVVLSVTKKNPAFVLLHFIEGKLYAITGGGGHLHIKPFIEEDFGIDAICRILDPNRIKALTQGEFVGSVIQQERIFRDFYDYNFDASNLSKLTKEIFGEISARTLRKVFKLTKKLEKSTKLSGKRGFWLGVSVSYDELVSVTVALHQISQLDRKFNTYRGYEPIKDRNLIKQLDEALLQELQIQFQEFCHNPDRHIDTRVHISYSDAKEMLRCDHFLILHHRIKDGNRLDQLDLRTLFSVLKKNGIKEFPSSFFNRIWIRGQSSDDEPTNVHGCLRKFLYAEIPEDAAIYYYYSGTWYVLSYEYEEQIQKKAAEIIHACSDPSFSLPEWKGWTINSEEGDFISEVCRNSLFVKMHNVPIYFHEGPGNSELCDIVSLDDNPNLVFIKRGTGISLRALFSQVRMSVQLFKESPKFRSEAISKLCSQRGNASQGRISFDRYGVVLAIIDNSLNRSKKPLSEKLSVLAKLELLDCVKFLRDNGIDRIIVHEIRRKMPKNEATSKTQSVPASL